MHFISTLMFSKRILLNTHKHIYPEKIMKSTIEAVFSNLISYFKGLLTRYFREVKLNYKIFENLKEVKTNFA